MYSTKMSNSEKKALKKIFDQYNTTADTWLDAKELQQVLEKEGLAKSPIEAYRIIAQADKDADGKVSFSELNDWLTSQRQKDSAHRSLFSVLLDDKVAQLEKKYKLDDRKEDKPILELTPSNTHAYHQFDADVYAKILVIFNDNKNVDGELDMFQFMSALKKAGDFTQSEMCMLVVKADQNGDTLVNFDEFITILWSNRDRLTFNGQKKQTETSAKEEYKDQKSIVPSSSVSTNAIEPVVEKQKKTSNELRQHSGKRTYALRLGAIATPPEIETDEVSAEDSKESWNEEHQPEEMVENKADDSDSGKSFSQDDKDNKKTVVEHESDIASVPQLAGAKYFIDLPAETKSRVLSASLDLLGQLKKLNISNVQQLDLLTRLVAFQKSKEDNIVDLYSSYI